MSKILMGSSVKRIKKNTDDNLVDEKDLRYLRQHEHTDTATQCQECFLGLIMHFCISKDTKDQGQI